MSEARTLRIGTRGSALAVWQAEHVAARLAEVWPGLRVRLERIRTTGDKIPDVPLASVGGKALFVKEIEEALIDGRVDLAVHSLKDVPADLPAGLCIAATPAREDPSDILISRTGARLQDLPQGARIGTSSLRRQAQLLNFRPDLDIVGLRGNLDTRIRKLETEGLDAIILARAGVKRLGLAHVITEVLPFEILLPAVGQGMLAIETRDASYEPRAESRDKTSDLSVAEIVAVLDDRDTSVAMRAERGFLRRLGGGCQVPIAALARVDGSDMHLAGLIADVDGRTVLRGETLGRAGNPDSAGIALAENLLAQGGQAILTRIYEGAQRG